jgi:hypothetical protein
MIRSGLVAKLIEANPHLSAREADIVVTMSSVRSSPRSVAATGSSYAVSVHFERSIVGLGAYRSISRTLGLAPNRSRFLW